MALSPAGSHWSGSARRNATPRRGVSIHTAQANCTGNLYIGYTRVGEELDTARAPNRGRHCNVCPFELSAGGRGQPVARTRPNANSTLTTTSREPNAFLRDALAGCPAGPALGRPRANGDR